MLAGKAKAREPAWNWVPWLMRWAMAQWRNACSAALLVSGSSGSASGRRITSQLFRNSRAMARVTECSSSRCFSHKRCSR